MSILASNKYISDDSISCGDELILTLALSAVKITRPVELVMVLDKSEGVEGEPLDSIKTAAGQLIDVIEDKFDGITTIATNSRAALISFNGDVTKDVMFTRDTNTMRGAVASLTAGGDSNLSLAITVAADMLVNPTRIDPSDKFIIVYTDGAWNTGDDPSAAAATAKALGITVIFVPIEGTSADALAEMEQLASQPGEAFVIKNYGTDASYDEFISNLTNNDLTGSTTDIALSDTIADEFEISKLPETNKGTYTLNGTRNITWNISDLAESPTVEGAVLTFAITHVGTESGEFEVNADINYSDDEGSTVSFASPEVAVNCGDIIVTDECPVPVDTVVSGCEETFVIDAGDISTEIMGRIAEINCTIRGVCPGRRVAFAAVLTELDEDGNEYQRGMRIITIPAHTFPSCRDVRIEGLKIIIPGDIDDMTAGTCEARNFRTRIFANIIDSGIVCPAEE